MKFDSNIMKSLSLLSQIGFLMAIPIIGCVLFGNFLDGRCDTSPLFLIIFTILGVLSAFRNLYVIAMKGTKNRKKDS
ncbi:AtpZ/AtpI family protein [Vallitalea pronyensis]|uniref:AtpZ/AtpI family protein n=1 Tax=Vallitalea pronyensis TaxID=1348613 RepID=A0A8J8SF56_9FIRM|nr:AtpZ/AtpI family protein [Vallitalea pronyensis]QUI20909.1 AtpZ/AtpI family protein [Vallitalea pronyensis]